MVPSVYNLVFVVIVRDHFGQKNHAFCKPWAVARSNRSHELKNKETRNPTESDFNSEPEGVSFTSKILIKI